MISTSLLNIFWLGMKELRSLTSDLVMLVFVIYAFTGAIYIQATGTSSEVNNASLAFVDEDGSALSKELMNSFFPPRFQHPRLIQAHEVEDAMDKGEYMFVVVVPPRFQADLLAGRDASVQLNIDATAMQQASIGAGYIRNIITDRVASFLARTDERPPAPVNLVIRKLFNPNGISSWRTSVVAIINQITLLTVVLTGAAVLREREHGTLEHLLVMPLSAFEIAMAKVVANGLVILLATVTSMFLVVRWALQVPFAGSVPLWLMGVVLYLFFATALGIFLGTISRSMAQFSLLIILIVMVLQLLSGGSTPVESQPQWLQYLTFLLPSRHFVSFSQVIIYRGGGFQAVWPQFLMVGIIGLLFFFYSLSLFRRSIAVTKWSINLGSLPYSYCPQHDRERLMSKHSKRKKSALVASTSRMKNREYQPQLRQLHVELVKMQEWIRHRGLKLCILFEGRDGAGKGGVIKAITERVSPRIFRVVALPAPTEREKSQMYLQRYIPYLPGAGEVVIFDRSWYNRAGIERVMGFCTMEQVRRFLAMAPLVEKSIVDSGVILLKYWLDVSPEEQSRRLKDRIDDGRKIWKLSAMDLKSYDCWDDYTQARDEMIAATDLDWAPWFVAQSDDKKRARLNIISHILSQVPYQEVPRDRAKLPKHREVGKYQAMDYPFKLIPQTY